MFWTAIPPAAVNVPPAQSKGPLPSSYSASERICVLVPLTPLPSGDQPAPAHLAMLLAGMPPALVNIPPTNNAGPLPSSWTASAQTAPFVPPPTADQLVPSHLARPCVVTPPEFRK